MKFNYPKEKFSDARRILMLPHSRSEADVIAKAFHECSLGMRDVKNEDLDDNARAWVSKLKVLMDTSEIQDSSGRGNWAIKAERLTQDQKSELSNTIDELAHWFDRNNG